MSTLRKSAASSGEDVNRNPDVSGNTRRALLKIVRAAQPISRSCLARRLGVNRSTVTEIVKPFVASGLLRESAAENASPRRSSGRPPVGLAFDAAQSCVAGITLGVQHSHVGLATIDGRTLSEESFDTPAITSLALTRIRLSLQHQRASNPGHNLHAIGVSVPGAVDAHRTTLLYAPHLNWRNVAVADALCLKNKSNFPPGGRSVPVIVESEAAATAIDEAQRRLRDVARSAENDFILVRVGTSINASLVIGGEIYRGSKSENVFAAEFGHMTIVAGGKLCVCGNRGCWECYASVASAIALYTGDRSHLKREYAPRFQEIVARAAAGELRARRTLERVGEYLGIGIGNLICGLCVTRVLVSGELTRGWQFLRQSAQDAVSRTMAGRLASCSLQSCDSERGELDRAFTVAAERAIAMLCNATQPRNSVKRKSRSPLNASLHTESLTGNAPPSTNAIHVS